MPSIFIKSLRPRPIRLKGYRDEILNQLRKEGKQMRTLYAKSTRTWKPPVRFRTDVRVAGVDAVVKVSTKDKRFIFVDKGTSRRWAVMSPGYSPKSQVRSLTARMGRGRVVVRGEQAMRATGHIRPLPGIKARNFSIEIRKLRRRPFFTNMRRAMARAARGTF